MAWRRSLRYLILIALSTKLTTAHGTNKDLVICADGYVHDSSSGTCKSHFEYEGDDLDPDNEWESYTEDMEYNNETWLEQDDELHEYNQLNIAESVEQELPENTEQMEAVQLVIDRMYEYLNHDMFLSNMTRLRDLCVNKDSQCAFWASVGECDVNPGYMKVECALACQSCDKLDIHNRCPIDPNAVDIWKPGDLHEMFQRIAYGPEYSTYKVQVLSEPSLENTFRQDYGPLPWVIIIDDFISEEECKRLIELGAQRGYERSRDVGEEQADGTFSSVESLGRTSKNAWCQEECYEDATVKTVIRKIEKLTGIPDANSEHLQLLKYEEGQFYMTHHDFIDYQVNRNCGPRVITAFLYLNDVEAGGGTNFPEMNLTVMPKQGRILLWPSVLNHDLNALDPWTHHQALPVEKGIKYGANGWLHLRDYKTPHSIGCA